MHIRGNLSLLLHVNHCHARLCLLMMVPYCICLNMNGSAGIYGIIIQKTMSMNCFSSQIVIHVVE